MSLRRRPKAVTRVEFILPLTWFGKPRAYGRLNYSRASTDHTGRLVWRPDQTDLSGFFGGKLRPYGWASGYPRLRLRFSLMPVELAHPTQPNRPACSQGRGA